MSVVSDDMVFFVPPLYLCYTHKQNDPTHVGIAFKSARKERCFKNDYKYYASIWPYTRQNKITIFIYFERAKDII